MLNQTLAIMFALVTQSQHLPQGLLSSLCYVESGHRINAIHHDDGGGNSVGVCQIKLITARSLGFKGTEYDLQDPKTNILYSGKYIRRQLDRYRNDNIKAIAAYNAGTWKLNSIGEIKNRHYVHKVLKAWGEHR